MSATLAAAGITAGLSAASGAAQIIGNKRQQKRAYKYGEMAAENAYQRQLDYWNKTLADQQSWAKEWFRDYESESAQIERLKAAGLSPGLFYSSGGTPGGAVTASGETSAPQGSPQGAAPYDFNPAGQLDAITRALSLRAQEAQIENIQADTEEKRGRAGRINHEISYIDSQTEANTALSENTRARTVGELLSNNLQEATLSNNIELSNLTVRQNIELLETYIEQAEQSALETDFKRETFDDRKELLRKDLQLKTSGVALQYAVAAATQQGIKLTEAQIEALRTAIDTEIYSERPLLKEKLRRAYIDRAHGQKDLDWYTADKIEGYIKDVAQTAIGVIGISKLAKSRKSGKQTDSYTTTYKDKHGVTHRDHSSYTR